MNQNKQLFKMLFALVFIGFILYFFYGGGIEKQVKTDETNIRTNMVTDDIDQYNIVKKNGNAMDAYIKAQSVTEDYLQLKDDENYKKWKEIENKEAKNAGMKNE